MNKKEIIEKIKSRHSVRGFDTKKNVQDYIELIKQAFVFSPSSVNIQPWKLLIISSDSLKERLADSSHYNRERVRDAPLLLVFLAKKEIDSSYFEKLNRETQRVRGLSEEQYHKLTERTSQYVFQQDQSRYISNQIYLNCGTLIAYLNILDVGTCPMEGLDRESYDRILGIENTPYKTCLGLLVGFSDPSKDINRVEFTKKVRFKEDELIKEIK